jgi:shikimate kinase
MKGLVLVGFMGTGKTEVGRRLAARLGWPLLDTDDLVVQNAGKDIPRIFAEDGEPAFRAAETAALRSLAAAAAVPRVIATGGGIVLAEENWPLLRALGDVVCLTAEPGTVLQRVGAAPDRPLLAGTPDQVRARIQDLLARRRDAYARADWQCPTDGLTPAAVADRVLRWREERGTTPA